MTTTTPRPTVSHWDRRRDSYGRATYVAITAEGGEYGDLALVGVVVKLPRLYTETEPGRNFLVNLWGKDEVTYHATLKGAKAHFAANALTMVEYRG